MSAPELIGLPLYDAALAALDAAADEVEATLADADLSLETAAQIATGLDAAQRGLQTLRLRGEIRGGKLFRRMLREGATPDELARGRE